MDQSCKAAYIISQSIAALAEIEGMKAENKEREILGHSPVYGETAFLSVIEKYDLGTNSVINYLNS
jgi:hypothetical protein